MLEIVHSLTSPSKVSVFGLLANPATPDYISSELGITRQAVDKHLKEFQSYGMVRKMWLLSSGRPRIQYVATELGRHFYAEMESFVQSYRSMGRDHLKDELKTLDLKFINGEMGREEYTSMKEALEKESEWFHSGNTPE